MMMNRRKYGFSLLEMLAAVTILGIVALIIIPRMSGSTDNAKISTCHVNKGNIEVQCQLWFRNKGVWPKSDLSDIGADGDYF
ncbi:MAG: general secretion pathway protein G, partial [Pirellulaceae bacterium]